MKTLLSMPGELIYTEDGRWVVKNANDGKYYDISGSLFVGNVSKITESDDPWDSDWIEYEGIKEPLISESVETIKWEIDDGFGKFGFKNKAGDFIIEPQYAYAHEFTCGLASVNLNRTWYKSKEGHSYYENHFGYINERGETVIPFAYDEAWPFNKFGVAVVENTGGRGYIIDTGGKKIPGTEKMDFGHHYGYSDRYFSFKYVDNDAEFYDEAPVGIYDTKEKRVLVEPSLDDFIEWDEDRIHVYGFVDNDREKGADNYLMNGKGERLFPWLYGKGFWGFDWPNESLVAIVAANRKHGLYTSKERFLLPIEYDIIREISNNIFACWNWSDKVISIIQVEDADC